MEINRIQDFPALQQLARALWGEGTTRGAAVLVGAGFSKYAERPGPDTPEPPLWNDLRRQMAEQLYGQASAGPNDPLRIAEVYRNYFGQAALDEFIRKNVPDLAWAPGPLHLALLSLPWSDVLTTNWDTLLERASHSVNEFLYEPVNSAADLAHTRAPRIVKLHGSIGHTDHFVIAEEDYRKYPIHFAAFVNFARQVFIENELCLIGFSGDDPNFLQWSGWVRDNLGGSTRRIYLVGVLNLTPPIRKFLETRNIAPIDLTSLVQGVDASERHSVATKQFLEFLATNKPSAAYQWRPAGPSAYTDTPKTPEDLQRQFKDDRYASTLLNSAADVWHRDRSTYPDWLICPSGRRSELGGQTNTAILVRHGSLDALTNVRRSEVLYELAWRYNVSLIPIPAQLTSVLEQVADPATKCGLEMRQQLDIAVVLLRSARLLHNLANLTRWAGVIERNAKNGSDYRAEVTYQRCLYARDELDFSRLNAMQEEVAGPDPMWRVRRASLLAELGRFSEAGKLINEALVELSARQRRDKNSLWVRSRRAWAEWLALAFQRDTLTPRTERRWPTEFTEANCDPWDETESLENEARRELREQRDTASDITPLFEAGQYRPAPTSIRIISDPDATPLKKLDLLTERVGIPLRLNYVSLVVEAAKDAAEGAFQPVVEWYAWLVRILHSSQETLFGRYFGRITVACLPNDTVSKLAGAIRGSVGFWRDQVSKAFRERGRFDTHAVNRLRFMIDALSRLTPRMSPNDARTSFDLAIELANNASIRHWWIFEPIGNLAKFSSQAIEPSDRSALVLSALKFPLSSEIGAPTGVPSRDWPNPVSFLFGVAPARPSGDLEWQRRISGLISAATAGSSGRGEALLRLTYLSKHSALDEGERQKLAQALWSAVDEQNGLPSNTHLLPHVLAELPAPQGIDAKALVQSRLYGLDVTTVLYLRVPVGSLQIEEKQAWLQSMVAASQSGIWPTPDQAVTIFDAIARWRPETDPDDSIRASFQASHNNRVRRLAGEALATSIVPAMEGKARTEQRGRAMLNLIVDANVNAAVAALPYFSANDAISTDIRRRIRLSVRGRTFDDAGAGARAIEIWAKLQLEEQAAALPDELIDLVISSIEEGHGTGLHATLHCARSLVTLGLIPSHTLPRLDRALSELIAETAYDRIDPQASAAINVSLVRAECVRMAYALQQASANGPGATEWLAVAANDPLPEVRFALLE